jgi:hypothetical protein
MGFQESGYYPAEQPDIPALPEDNLLGLLGL